MDAKKKVMEDFRDQHFPQENKTMLGIRVKFKDSSMKFNPEYHEESLQDKIALIFGGNKHVKDISFSEDMEHAYIELHNPEDIQKLMKHEITIGRTKRILVKEEIDLMEIKRPYLKIFGLEEWMPGDFIKEHFEEVTKEKIQSVDICSDSGTAIIKFFDPKACLKVDSSSELVGTEVSIMVEYEIPTTSIEGSLALVMEPLPNLPEKVVKNQLNKYFMKHFSISPVECKIISKTAYLIFENSAVVKHIVAHPPNYSFSLGIKMSSQPASEVISPHKDETQEERDASEVITPHKGETQEQRDALVLNNPSSSTLNLSSSKSSKTLDESLTEAQISDNTLGLSNNKTSETMKECLAEAEISEELATESPVSEPSLLESSVTNLVHLQPDSQHMPQQSGYEANSMLNIILGSNSQPCALQDKKNDSVSILDENESHEESLLSTPIVYLRTEQQHTTKVWIDDIPSIKRDAAQLETYMKNLMDLLCSVKQHGKHFVATFEQVIDLNQLKMRGTKYPFGGVHLSFYKLDPTDTILVANIPKYLPGPGGYLKFHFERFTGKNSVETVTFISESTACIKFYKCEYVQQALSAECTKVGEHILTVSEHYNGIDDVEAMEPVFSPRVPGKHTWKPVRFEVKFLEALWLEDNLNDLNNKLEKLSAYACMNKEESNVLLEIVPLEVSSSLDNWHLDVENVLAETRKTYLEISIQIPENLVGDVFQHAQNFSRPTLHVRLNDSTLVIGGYQTLVKQLEDELRQLIIELQIESEEKNYPKRFVYCVSHFYGQNLAFSGMVYSLLSHEQGKIFVSGNQYGRQQFWEAIESCIQLVQEKSCRVSKHLFKLLQSDKGSKRMDKIFGSSRENIIHYQEQTADSFTVYFMSCVVQKDTLKKKKNEFKKCFSDNQIEITNTQLRGCGDRRWHDFVKSLECNHLVTIEVDPSIPSIFVAGEKIVISDICSEIKKKLLDIVSIEEKLVLSNHEWKVINFHFIQKIETIKKDFKDVSIITPIKGEVKGSQAILTLQGNPVAVVNAKTRLASLQSEVHLKEHKMKSIPAARQIINRMQDKIQQTETTMHASIDVSVIKEKSSVSTKYGKRAILQPQSSCFATLKNESHIVVYQEDFTKHNHCDVIINFVSLSPCDLDANLKELKATKHGSQIFDNFMTRFNCTQPVAGKILKSEYHDDINCGQLWHVLLDFWRGGKNNEAFLLGKILEEIFNEAGGSTTILLTTICARPLNYPAEVFAKTIIETMDKLLPFQVVVYVDKPSDAREFERQFKHPKNECHLLKQEMQRSSTVERLEKKLQSTNKQPKHSNFVIERADFIKMDIGDLIKTKVMTIQY